jgi:starch phosphorylase
VLAERYVRPVAAELGIDPDALLALGRHEPDDPDDSFCPTVLALRLAGNRNAVSALHAEVTRQMWRGLWPRVPLPEVPIGHVTNGVHLPSWVAPETSELLADALGTGLEGDGGEPLPWGRVRELEPERVWAARCAQRQRLVERSRSWLTLQGVRRGNRAVVPDPEGRLDPDALTIGFVGRFVAYKRPTLFLTDQTRLRRIMSDDARPVQIVFAGRAHPTDYAGKALLREVVAFARREGLAHRLVFLEDFDIAMDHWLSQGVDLWLNTPRRPDEACGIAGMKAGINGALNFSTVDGWWDEVWRAATPSEIPLGWAIGGREPFGATTDQDHFDAASFYDVLEHEVVPAFYERDQDGTPLGWVAMVQESIARLGNLWTSSRMVREYTDSYYAPGAARAARLTERRAVGARSVARHLARLAAEWPGVAVADVQVRRVGDGGARVLASVSLGALSPRDVSVEVWIDRPDGRAGPGPAPMTPLSRPGDGHRVYETRLAPALVPEGAIVAARVLPRHRALDDPMSTGLIAWSS